MSAAPQPPVIAAPHNAVIASAARQSMSQTLRNEPHLEFAVLIELRRANLAMRASVAEEGIPLSGEDSLAWAHFLQRTWRELEDFYWDKQHAA